MVFPLYRENHFQSLDIIVNDISSLIKGLLNPIKKQNLLA